MRIHSNTTLVLNHASLSSHPTSTAETQTLDLRQITRDYSGAESRLALLPSYLHC